MLYLTFKRINIQTDMNTLFKTIDYVKIIKLLQKLSLLDQISLTYLLILLYLHLQIGNIVPRGWGTTT